MKSIGCGFLIAIMVLNLTVGAWSVDKILSWIGKDIPMIGDMVIGLFVAEISIPVAVVGSILKYFL